MIWPLDTAIALVAACSLLYLVVSIYKFRLTLRALGTHLETDVTDEEIAALDERRLPMYTILVPLYKEAAIVPRLVRDINALDYPRTRLDVKLLCEEDDEETSPRSARCSYRRTSTSWWSPTASRRRSRRPATTASSSRPVTSASSSTPRTGPTPTS